MDVGMSAMHILYECTRICMHYFLLVMERLRNSEISNLLSMPISVLWAVLKLSRNYLHIGCSFEHFRWCLELYGVL